MKKLILLAGISGLFLTSCNQNKPQATETKTEKPAEFDYVADRFADIQVIRYQIKGFEDLTLKQKQLAYYLYQAGMSGRDIFYDQKNKNNLRVRKTIECVLETYKGDKNTVLGKRAKDLEEGRAMAEKAMADGSAFEKFRVLVQAQGGDVSYVDDVSKFPRAKFVSVVNAPRNGIISQVQARSVGEASVTLGAGRAKKSDAVDHAVGFVIHKKVGDQVTIGEPLFTIHANDESKLVEAREAVLAAHSFSDTVVPPLPLFYE